MSRVARSFDLYWLPLGAGGRFVRLNGRAYEAVMARIERRPACHLYHSALQDAAEGLVSDLQRRATGSARRGRPA